MTKWEHAYALAYDDKLEMMNGISAGQSSLLADIKGPSVSQFLSKMGQDGWEVVGICPASEHAGRWRIILKRPIASW